MPRAGVVDHLIRVVLGRRRSGPPEQAFSMSDGMSQLLEIGIAPKPMNMPGLGRRVFDRYALDTCSKGAA
jgi:hypothetical protein